MINLRIWTTDGASDGGISTTFGRGSLLNGQHVLGVCRVSLHIQRKREIKPCADDCQLLHQRIFAFRMRLTSQPAGQCLISPLYLEIIPQAQVLLGALEEPLWFISSYKYIHGNFSSCGKGCRWDIFIQISRVR